MFLDRDQDVVALDVAVHDAPRVGHGERREHLLDHVDDPRERAALRE